MELHTKSIMLFPEHQNYQAGIQDNDAKRKASGWKRCLGGSIEKLTCVCRVTYFCTS